MDVLPIQVTDAGVMIPRVYLQNADSFDVTVVDDYVIIKSRRTHGDVINQDFPPHDQYMIMQQEQIAFRRMHPQLWQSYPSQYVAIHDAIVVDHDIDAYALTLRVRTHFAGQPVLIQQVAETSEEIAVLRSPRLTQHSA